MEETWVDKIVQQNYISDIRRFAIGALLAASISWGWPAFVATGVVATAISGVEFHYDRKSKQKALLNLYRDDIAALENKKPDDVTIQDLEKAGRPVENGGHGIKAISEGLKRYDWDQKFRWFANLTSSAIVTGVLVATAIAVPALLANISTILGLGLVGLGYLAVNRTVRATAETFIGHQDREERFNQQLLDISQTIKREPVSPMQVFSEFAQVNTELSSDIKQRFGKTFDDLTIMQKRQAIDTYEPQYRTVALTNEINNGTIKPSLIGLLAYGQGDDRIADFRKYKQLFNEPVHSISEVEEQHHSTSRFADRISQERQAGVDTSKSIH